MLLKSHICILFLHYSNDNVTMQNYKLLKKYNELCSSVDDPKFVPHFATWLNQARWEEELPSKTSPIDFGIQPKKSHKDYVYAVKKGMRLLAITDDMVREVLESGAKKAREIASAKMTDVRQKIGVTV